MAAANGSDTGLMMPNSENDSRVWTTNLGHPVSDNISSLTIGRRGPAVIEDYHLLEKLAQFDRERIPERVVHARGMAAKGYFEVTKDITHLSCADLFSEVGKRTPLIARLSTVIHERGSPESLRDVRGFSVKFYTQEGNWDFVGNNIPVFFIRDAMNFVDLVHALKPDPRSHLQRGWRILDFLSHHPESCHTLTWLLDDNGIPANWRNMEGFGVHTFKLVAQDGKETLVKFHWQPKNGAEFLDDEEATQVGQANKRQSHATQDLYEAIEAGNYPEWKFLIQTMDPADQESLAFDPLDATKLWPEEQFPLQEVGRMVLDKNVDNWFNENEMLAFSPGVIVPGIAFSDDKLLQGRIFSYSDTQRYRLGANYALLPVNQPKCPYHNNHYDGLMNMTLRNEDIDYFPSRMNSMKEVAKGPTYSQAPVEGKREKSVIDKEENFMQAGQRIRGMDERRRNNFIKRLLQWMTEPQCTNEVRQIWLGYWSECDKAFGAELAAKLDEAMAKADEE